jgi:hypothetical protein
MNSGQVAESTTTRVYLELGSKRAFACALDWPGWCRSGKGETEALEALAAYAPRYSAVTLQAGLPASAIATRFEVTDRLPGSATTDFGGLSAIARQDTDPMTAVEAGQIAALVAAAWTVLDRVAATAPAELRKGPRGGGRNRDAVVEHVLAAQTAYAR